MNYIDGFVATVPTVKRDASKQRAERTALVFKDHGALGIVYGVTTFPTES